MSTHQAGVWQHSNKYNADSACEYCQGIVRHENWCVARNQAVLYAYHAVQDASVLSEGDRLILHALGVAWKDLPCAGARKPAMNGTQ